MSRVIVYGHKATPAQLGAGVCFESCERREAAHNTLFLEGVDVDLLVAGVQQVVGLLAALCGWALVHPCVCEAGALAQEHTTPRAAYLL